MMLFTIALFAVVFSCGKSMDKSSVEEREYSKCNIDEIPGNSFQCPVLDSGLVPHGEKCQVTDVSEQKKTYVVKCVHGSWIYDKPGISLKRSKRQAFTLGGAATGAAIGLIFGPIGGLVGGIIGLAGGLICDFFCPKNPMRKFLLMELRTVVEASGEEVTYKYYDGIHFPIYIPGDSKERVDRVLDMKYKDGDVLIASYPKAAVYNSWFEHAMAWQKFMVDNPDYPILSISFEEMKKDLRSSIRRLAGFLGLKHELTFLDEVTRRCEFISVIQEKTNNMSDRMKSVSRDGKHPFYRKGDVGDWKNWFTVAQNELFDKRNKENISTTDLPVQYIL